jgi:hypothetical protein
MRDPVKEFYYSAAGRAYLEVAYLGEGKSLREIAEERGGYAVLIQRAMEHHGMGRRDRSDSMKKALLRGRLAPPPADKPPKVRERIGDAVRKAWKAGVYDRESYAERARKQGTPPPPSKSSLAGRRQPPGRWRLAVLAAVRRAAPDARIRERHYLGRRWVRLDAWVPSTRLAIMVLGAADVNPVFGEDDLGKRALKHAEARAAVLKDGGTVLVVRTGRHSWTGGAIRDTAREVARAVRKLIHNPPPLGERLIEMEVK